MKLLALVFRACRAKAFADSSRSNANYSESLIAKLAIFNANQYFFLFCQDYPCMEFIYRLVFELRKFARDRQFVTASRPESSQFKMDW